MTFIRTMLSCTLVVAVSSADECEAVRPQHEILYDEDCEAISVESDLRDLRPVSFLQAPIQKHVTQDHVDEDSKRSLKVAIATIAPYGVLKSKAGWQDAFAVLSHSIQQTMKASRHKYDLLAIVPDDIGNQEGETHAFENLGWTVRFVPIPVRLDEIKNEEGREILSKVLGENEELKYYGANFTEYDRVLVVDGDTLFVKPIDELMDLSPTPGLVGVYDHEMDIQSSSFPPVNSGFLLITPSANDFQGLVEVFREGDIGGAGFRKSGTGYTYGAGSQGMMSFFYNQWTPKAPGFKNIRADKGVDLPGMKWTKQPLGSRFHPVDRSMYNVIETDNLHKAISAGKASSDSVKVFHFAGKCLKPWTCQGSPSPVCQNVTDQWWSFRNEVARAKGKSTKRCKKWGTYEPMQLL